MSTLAAMTCSSARCPAVRRFASAALRTERRPSRQYAADDRGVVGRRPRGGSGSSDHPVADSRVVRRGQCVEAEAAGDLGRPIGGGQAVTHDRRLLVDGHDPGRPAPRDRERREGVGPDRIPAEPAAQRGRRLSRLA